jgi:hypothetical protein
MQAEEEEDDHSYEPVDAYRDFSRFVSARSDDSKNEDSKNDFSKKNSDSKNDFSKKNSDSKNDNYENDDPTKVLYENDDSDSGAFKTEASAKWFQQLIETTEYDMVGENCLTYKKYSIIYRHLQYSGNNTILHLPQLTKYLGT